MLVLPFRANQAELDVFVDCRIEQGVVLLHEPYLIPPPLYVDLGKLSPRNRNQSIAQPKNLKQLVNIAKRIPEKETE